MQSGTVSESHRDALNFASREYGRLANSPAETTPANASIRERLQQKAIWLQRYAVAQPAIAAVGP
jgi:hypothetical protein